MSLQQSEVFAPRWLRCAPCTVASLSLPGLITIVWISGQSSLLWASPAALYFSTFGLNCLVTGKPPQKSVLVSLSEIAKSIIPKRQ
jgi:hypothetical protein